MTQSSAGFDEYGPQRIGFIHFAKFRERDPLES
jgi:hypothetical protein